MQYCAITDIGKKRISNQDCFRISKIGDYFISVVCDGMGGANGGDVAGTIAAQTFCDKLNEFIDLHTRTNEDFMQNAETFIQKAIASANEKVYKAALKNKELSGMGTTLVSCIIKKNDLLSINIGDSRLYHIQKNKMTALTVDHSLVQSLVDSGQITKKEAKKHPDKNIITRALGVEDTVIADITHHEITDGYLLLCSDGFSNFVEEKDVLKIISEKTDCIKKANKLMQHSLKKGGSDNITIVLIEI